LDIKHDERYVVILLAIFKIGAMYVESSVFSLLSNIKLRFVNNGREENNFDDANIKVINIDQNWSEMTTKLYDDINPKMGFKLKKESLQDGISIRMLNGSSIK
jgi:hypothetical protein